jgi:Holliday junction resolvasome RuvABC endonuclease subunit
MCVFDPEKKFSFENCEFFCRMKNPSQKLEAAWKSWPAQIKASKQRISKNKIENYYNLADFFAGILSKFEVSQLAIEGYAYAAKGNVFDIAEACGILKSEILRRDIFYSPKIIAPAESKKLFAGKGSAKKEDMISAVKELFGIDLCESLKLRPQDPPVSDIADSFALMSILSLHTK